MMGGRSGDNLASGFEDSVRRLLELGDSIVSAGSLAVALATQRVLQLSVVLSSLAQGHCTIGDRREQCDVLKVLGDLPDLALVEEILPIDRSEQWWNDVSHPFRVALDLDLGFLQRGCPVRILLATEDWLLVAHEPLLMEVVRQMVSAGAKVCTISIQPGGESCKAVRLHRGQSGDIVAGVLWQREVGGFGPMTLELRPRTLKMWKGEFDIACSQPFTRLSLVQV